MASKPSVTHEDIVKRLETLEETIKEHVTAEKDIAEVLTVALERTTSDSAKSVWAEHYEKTFNMLFVQVSNAVEKAGREVKSLNTPEVIKAFNDAFDKHASRIGTAMNSNFNNNRMIIDKIGVSVKKEINETHEALNQSVVASAKLSKIANALFRDSNWLFAELVDLMGKMFEPKPSLKEKIKAILFSGIFLCGIFKKKKNKGAEE